MSGEETLSSSGREPDSDQGMLTPADAKRFKHSHARCLQSGPTRRRSRTASSVPLQSCTLTKLGRDGGMFFLNKHSVISVPARMFNSAFLC